MSICDIVTLFFLRLIMCVFRLITAFLFLTTVCCCFSDTALIDENSEISLGSHIVNARIGPGEEYPVVYVYKRKYLPVKVITKYNDWYRIQDHESSKSWVHKRLLSKRKSIFVLKNYSVLYKSPKNSSVKIARLEKGVVGIVINNTNKDFVKIQINGLKGWVRRADVCGVSCE